ncbi:MAG TPA: hypothetical protein PKZ32_22950, partial [Candidatus Melainabacteria bacterium]|nr:hypothetical protein [Candidatus Melainabacteria bacterium]
EHAVSNWQAMDFAQKAVIKERLILERSYRQSDKVAKHQPIATLQPQSVSTFSCSHFSGISRSTKEVAS